jgi:hypothetical protein
MLARIARRLHLISIRQLSGCLALLLLAGGLSGCLEDSPPSTTKPTAARPTNTPKPAAARPTATPKPAASAGNSKTDDWTVLVYLDGDNNLEAEAIGDYAEMSSVGSNPHMNIVVQFDRIGSDEDWDDTSNGDWKGVKRFRVERGKKPTKSNQLDDLGERNMGDPRTLVDFASWGIKSYPAKHYALIFWDHGASWPGVANDDSSDSDLITLPELAGALADVRKNTGVQKLDLIGFDACLMGQIDVLQAVAPFGEVAIGSADLEPGEGWAWNAWLKDLATKPPESAAALAPSIIKSFTAFYKEEDDPSVTLAAFDLSKIELMTKQLDTLSSAMIAAMPKSFKAIGKARSYAAEYASGDTDISAIDLGYFADSLVSAGADKPVADAARALSKTIKAARIAHGHGADHPKSSGISVYFPRKKKHYDSTYIKSSPLTKATHWEEFLQAFYKGGKSDTARSAVSKPTLNSLTARPDQPINLQATISGDDTAYVYYFVGQVAPADPNTVQILSMDYLYPPGAALNDAIPSWSDGDDVQLTWRSSSWYIGNGTDVVLAPFTPIDYGSSTYSVDGTYTTKKTGKSFPVSIEFDVTQDRGTLQHVWAFDKNGGDNPRPRELKPRAGDTFTPDITAYTTNNDDAEDRTIAGAPITFGSAPLTAFEGDAPSGDYVIGLMVENLAGDINDQYSDVTVDSPAGTATPAIPAALDAPATGAAAGTLAFHDEQLGFQIDYPQDWRSTSPGTDKVVFANEEDPNGAYLGVDVYALEGKQATANRAMLESLLEVDSQEPGYALRSDIQAVRMAGRDALRVEYVYQDQQGVLFHVVGVAVSGNAVDATYLITFDAPEATFAADKVTFERMLASFRIDS